MALAPAEFENFGVVSHKGDAYPMSVDFQMAIRSRPLEG